jgi:hypothetical protein
VQTDPHALRAGSVYGEERTVSAQSIQVGPRVRWGSADLAEHEKRSAGFRTLLPGPPTGRTTWKWERGGHGTRMLGGGSPPPTSMVARANARLLAKELHRI